MKKELLFLGGLALLALATGLSIDSFREHAAEAPGGAPIVFRPDEQAAPVGEWNLAEFRELVRQGGGIVLDARPDPVFRTGHVPGARNLSSRDFYRDYDRQKSFLEANRGQSMAVYCSGEACSDSVAVARLLTRLGYRNVAVFRGGWAEWTQGALPVETGDSR